MKKMLKALTSIGMVAFASSLPPVLCAGDDPSPEDMYFMDIPVVTASNKIEKLSDAPATVIVITKEEIEQRGYSNVLEIFDDLPGFDRSFTYGDLYERVYMRGFRKGSQNPFLFMIDGMNMNHLWANWNDIMVAVPLSNIRQIEIVYGPASAVYGANALMGVINVITRKDAPDDGTSSDVKAAAGSFEKRIIDGTYMYKKGDFRIRLTGSMYNGDFDKDSLENYEYTKSKYLTDRSLWGSFVDNPSVLNNSNPERHRACTLNAFFRDTELGAQYYRFASGWGLNYAFDKVAPSSLWISPETNMYILNQHKMNDAVTAHSLLRYRESSVNNESNDLEENVVNGVRNLVFEYWQTVSRSWIFQEDFDVNAGNALTFKTGFSYEQKDLQKAYDIIVGPNVTPAATEVPGYEYPYPRPVDDVFQSQNRFYIVEQDVYVQSKYVLSPAHAVNLGVRVADNSLYGSHTVSRCGLVSQYDEWGTKLLYGESFQEPSARDLYGAWGGVGSNGNLKPEESKTIEAQLNCNMSGWSWLVNPYYSIVDNTVDYTLGLGPLSAPRNIGTRTLVGVDAHVQKAIVIPGMKSVKLWGYYTYATTREPKYNAAGEEIGEGRVGDIADHKVHIGATGAFTRNLSATVLCRYIGERPTVSTNPVPKVDAVFTMDSNILCRNVITKGLDLSFRVKNIFDTHYYDPGIRAADAGDTPGYWNGTTWVGSSGWTNSLLPQPGRSFMVSLTLKY